MAVSDIAPFLQLGFAAVMAILIWRGYERITGTLLKVVQDNTTAMKGLEAVISEHTRTAERIAAKVEQLDNRVGHLEHERTAR